eukprot:CAMPEP_0114145726 /NCGR_PEP_ID=MMETSP0043_2-20121206/20196_1 /TAXON_ID=464988 /ORGANISM="Hemiselmis andersenii, Strain CCMP644" /LENGTH=36 /DNA_ID= /DNA_START= /DNA_END= /DNA_ORIENTATION=
MSALPARRASMTLPAPAWLMMRSLDAMSSAMEALYW